MYPPAPTPHRMKKLDFRSMWHFGSGNKHLTKCEKSPPKSSKNEMFVFGLRSISDDWPSNLSNEHLPKCEKRPLSHLQMKWLLVLAGVILLVISRAPAYWLMLIRLMLVMFISSVDVVLMIQLTILTSFLVFLFNFSFGSFFLFFLGCNLVSSCSSRYSSFSCS